MKLPTHKVSIAKINSQEWLFDELVLQIEKDFQLFDNQLVLREKNIRLLHDQLLSVLRVLLVQSPTTLNQLLYKIDVSEHLLKDQMDSGRYSSFEELCTSLIMEREVKKVIIRNVLSGKLLFS